jgi:hypothetical protein
MQITKIEYFEDDGKPMILIHDQYDNMQEIPYAYSVASRLREAMLDNADIDIE